MRTHQCPGPELSAHTLTKRSKARKQPREAWHAGHVARPTCPCQPRRHRAPRQSPTSSRCRAAHAAQQGGLGTPQQGETENRPAAGVIDRRGPHKLIRAGGETGLSAFRCDSAGGRLSAMLRSNSVVRRRRRSRRSWGYIPRPEYRVADILVPVTSHFGPEYCILPSKGAI